MKTKDLKKNKVRVILIFMIILSSVINMTLNVCAESLPIKTFNDRVLGGGTTVLLENGDLVRSKGYLTSNTVVEVKEENVLEMSGSMILFKDGTLVNTATGSNKIVDTDVSQVIEGCFYLKNGTIYSYYNSHLKYDNIKKMLFVQRNTEIFAIDTGDNLVLCYNGNKLKIADDVACTIMDSNSSNRYLITKSNELFSFDIDQSKGTVQLNKLADNISINNTEFGKFGLFITNDNRLVLVNHNKMLKISENNQIQKVCYIPDPLYKTTYYCMLLNGSIVRIEDFNSNNVKYTILDSGKGYIEYHKKWKIDKDGQLLYTTNNAYIGQNRTVDYDVDKIIQFDEDYALYKKKNGDIYYSTADGTPFLLPHALKRTNIIFNGEKLNLENNIQTKDNRSMYPFREILENIGATVIWDSQMQIAIGKLNGITVGFKIGTNEYTINGTTNYMDTQSYIDPVTNKTYIPIRYVAEALGFTVDWQPGDKENTIIIKKGNQYTNNTDLFNIEISADQYENLVDFGRYLYKSVDMIGLKTLMENKIKADSEFYKLIIANDTKSKNKDCILDMSTICIDGVLALGRTLGGDIDAGKSYIYDTSIGFVADSTIDLVDNPNQDDIIRAMCNSANIKNNEYYMRFQELHYKCGGNMTDKQIAEYVKIYQQMRINTRTLKMGAEYFDSKTSGNFWVNLRDVLGKVAINQIGNIKAALNGTDTWTLAGSYKPGEDLNKSILKKISKGIISDFINSNNEAFKTYGEDVEKLIDEFWGFLK